MCKYEILHSCQNVDNQANAHSQLVTYSNMDTVEDDWNKMAMDEIGRHTVR
jgi:hypothetical protein